MHTSKTAAGQWPPAKRRIAGWLAFCLAAVALMASSRLPFWKMRVVAPQYPKGLVLVLYADHLEGDVQEIDTLNHYIGMRPLAQGAKLERQLAIPGLVLAVAGLFAALVFSSSRLRFLFILPALLIPAVFVADLTWWLWNYGMYLDPKAPLNHSVKPFMPVVFGHGKMAQFSVVAAFAPGFWLATAAAVLAIVGVLCHPRAVRMPSPSTIIALLLALVVGSVRAEAKTLTVAPDSVLTTLQEALAVAESGDTVVLRGGIYSGPVEINKSVTLLGEQNAAIDGHGSGTVIRITAPRVVVRGVLIRHSGDILSHEDAGVVVAAPEVTLEDNRFEDVLFGIIVRRARGCVIRRNHLQSQLLPVARRGDLIRVWYSDDVVIEDNHVREGRDIVLWYSERILVRGNEVRRGRYGLHFMYCNDAKVERNRLLSNSVGIYLMYSARLRLSDNAIMRNRGPSGYGIGFKDMEETTVENNIIADNRVGIFMEHATGVFTRNVIVANDIGMQLFPTAVHNQLTQNSFIDNAEQVINDSMPETAQNRWSNNYWSDYRGFDADGNGQGDVPYRAMRLFERLTQYYPAFRLYAASPAAQAIDTAAAVFPLFAPHPKFEDPQPSMRPFFPAGSIAKGL